MLASDRWRLILDGGAPGCRNMAVDGALLLGARDTESARAWTHTLRLYWFEPPALSLGANQSLDDVDRGACRAAAIDIVRRPTGGRAVLHHGCITYSLCGPEDGPVFGGGIRASYQRIAAALAGAVHDMGLANVLPAPPESRASPGPSCFDAAAPYELLSHGWKLVGSAQVRRGGAVLQHGSLRLQAGTVATGSLLRARAGRASPSASDDPPTLSDLLGRAVSRDEAATAMLRAFEQTFVVQLCPGGLTDAERQQATVQESERYRSSDWTARR